MTAFLLLFTAYLVGSVPTSHWIARGIHGVDLRNEGSGNLGATNTFRVLGGKAALVVLIVDVGKGWLPVWLFPRIDGSEGWTMWALAYGAAAILGHVFSLWVRFRGGKGVATSAGVLLALSPWALLAGFGAWMAAVLVTRIVSVGSLTGAVTVPVVTWWMPPAEGAEPILGFTAALSVFVIWAHRSNIRRLLRGEENRLREGWEER